MFNIRQRLNDTNAGFKKTLKLSVQALIILSLVIFSVSTLPDLSEEARLVLSKVNATIAVIFTVEYIVRITAAHNRRAYIFSFFGMVDLIAILPFYFSSGVDLMSLRLFRLLRLFLLIKLVCYTAAIKRFQLAFKIAKEEFVIFFSLMLIILYVAGVGIYYCEHSAQPETFASVPHSLWWAIITLTTVGYGDISPITAGGKFFTFLILLVGVGIVSMPAGIIASALAKARSMEGQTEFD